MMRWWWFGPSVTKPRLEEEMRLMKAGGIGGFEVQPVYPLELDEPGRQFRNLPFLSPEFIDALRFTGEKAKELGMRFDLTLGSGWPYGGPAIPITQAAGRLRAVKVARKAGQQYVPVPALSHGEKVLAAFTGTRQHQDSTRVDADDAQFFIASHTGMMVKRPSVGAEGFVLDHYDRKALETHLRTTAIPLLDSVKATPPYAAFCDSLEVFSSDWTADFPDEFLRRRGYDLIPHLATLASGTGSEAAGIRHDWGRTLTELLEDQFLQPLEQFAKKRGVNLRIQNYGIPPATLFSNRFGDISEGEGVDWKEVRAARWAASANHHFDRPQTTSETFTWLHSPSFRATPLDIKAEADIHFLQGVNQIIGHGWPYSPKEIEAPGWRFYAAGVFNHHNPWWIAMPDLSKYLQRMSQLMRTGKPAYDVALYLPSADAWSGFTPGRVHMIESLRALVGKVVMPEILESGYGLDFIDDGTLTVVSRYRVLVMPNVERVPMESLPLLEKFLSSGGKIVATGRLPSQAPGFRATAADHARVAKTAAGFTLVADERQLGAALRKLLPPDVAMDEPMAEFGFVHRKTESMDLYFVVNTGNTPRAIKASFLAGKGKQAEWWDPVTGQVSGATAGPDQAFTLEAYGSRVIAFSAKSAPPLPPYRTFEKLDLNSGWKVRIGSVEKTVTALTSWSDDPVTVFYSGTAVYEKEFKLPASLPARVELDLGEGHPLAIEKRRNGMRAWFDPPVREAAVIYVNGERAGALWCPPYRLDVTRLVKSGRNELRIEVANTAMNQMAGSPLPDYRLLNLRYGVRFEPQDMDQVRPLPSGLLGPVSLIYSQK